MSGIFVVWVELLFQLYSCLQFLMLTMYLQSVNEVPKLTSCTLAHFHSNLRRSHRRGSIPGTERGFPMWHMEDREVLAASFSGEQSSKTECKAILTQGSALSQETGLPSFMPPLLLVKQLGDRHSGSSTAQRNAQDKCSEGCVSLAQVKTHWRLWMPSPSRCLLPLLAPFLYTNMPLFKKRPH